MSNHKIHDKIHIQIFNYTFGSTTYASSLIIRPETIKYSVVTSTSYIVTLRAILREMKNVK